MKNVVSKLLSALCFIAAASLLVVACGDDSTKSGGNCPDGQVLAAIGDGPQECRQRCGTGGTCPVGQTCRQGACFPDSGGNNGTNNGTADMGGNNGTADMGGNNGTADMGGNNGTADMGGNNGNGCTESSIAGNCSPLCQTGCMTDEACVVGGGAPNFTTACQPSGTGQQGDTCGMNSPCAAGYNCVVTEQGATMGTCQKFCRPGGGEPACESGDECVPQTQDMTFGLCATPMDECEFYPNDDCPDGEKCLPLTIGKRCVTAGTATSGDSCSLSNQMLCDETSLCVPDQNNNEQCYTLCDPDNTTECEANEACSNVAQQGDPINVCLPTG